MSNSRHYFAFTVVELLIVIVIVSILATISIIAYTSTTQRASVASIQSDLTNNSKRLKLYQAQYGSYPTKLDTNYCPELPTPDTTGQYCLKLSSGNNINNYVGSINNYTLGISPSSNTSTCYQITSTSNPTNTCSAPSGSYAAEQLLNQAVWWIDASYSTNGQTISNLGTGGTQLDATNGSTTGTDTNDALYLYPEDSGYVYLSASNQNTMNVPQQESLNFTGDIDVRVQVALDNWSNPAVTQWLAGRSCGGLSQQWRLYVNTNGRLVLFRDTSTIGQQNYTSTVSTGISNGSKKWVRAVLDVDNGSGQTAVSFYLSDDGASWSQLGSTTTSTQASNRPVSNCPTNFGPTQDNANFNANGRFYRMVVLDSIDGAPVLDIDLDRITSGAVTSFTANTGQTVTINRSTSGRKSAIVPSIAKGGSPIYLFGTDDYMEVLDNDQLDFNGSNSFSVVTFVRRWNVVAKDEMFVGKMDNVGWLLSNSIGYGGLLSALRDGTNGSFDYSYATGTAGASQLISMVVDRSNQTMQTYVYNNGQGGVTSTLSVGDMSNSYPVRVGRLSNGWGGFADMEFVSAAVFRRALTPAEITTISNYYSGRVK